MPFLMVQASLPSDSAIPRDAAVNTFHFQCDGLDPVAQAPSCTDRVSAFYDDIDGLLSGGLDGTVALKVYNLEENPPRAPIYSINHNITPSTGDRLPNEVAICISYHAATISGIPRGRRRGRIYIGPLAASAVAEGTGDSIVDSGVTGALATAAGNLLSSNSTPGIRWSVFSPTLAGAPPWSTGDLVGATFEIVGGYVDNAFDTMRSRGADSTSRTVFP